MTWQSGLPRVATIAGQALLGDAQELVRMRGGLHRVDGDLDAAVGAVLEADRHREAGGQLAVDLALGRARADRAPGDGVGDELRRDRVEELAARPAARAAIRSSSSCRARRSPSLMAKLPSRCGSLISPFQPTVVRGFSK